MPRRRIVVSSKSEVPVEGLRQRLLRADLSSPSTYQADSLVVTRKHLSLAALAFVLVGLGIVLMPFSSKSTGDCSPAAVSAWQTKSVPAWSDPLMTTTTVESSTFDPVTHTWTTPPTNLDNILGRPRLVSVTTPCAKTALYRVESSGVLLGLTAIGWLVGSRILRPAPDSSAAS